MEPVPHDPALEPVRPVRPGGGAPAPRRRRWILAVVGVVILGAAFWAVRRTSTKPTGPAGGAPAPQAARAVPVTAAPVTRKDVPITLDGLGSVAAYRTVTVRSQLDGRLDQVLFREGQPVREGQVLAQIDPRPYQNQLHQAEGARARDAAQLATARLDLERYRALLKDKLIAPQQVDQQAGLVAQLEGAVRIDDAAIETAKLNLDYARITSPVDGVTGIRIVDPGNVVHAADQNGIVLVTQLDPIAVIFTLPQDHLPEVVEAMAQGTLPVDVFGRDGSTLLGTGKLELIDNQINQATSTMRLKAVLANPKHILWPNQFVNARLRLSVRKGALTVPATALQRGPNGVFVYVINADQTVAPRPVEVGGTIADLSVIAKGLTEGERVVTDGQNQLRPGSKVAPREPGQAQARQGQGPAPAGQGAPGQAQGQGGPPPQGAAPQAGGQGR
jgi:multidrug efflux system membrane fusion protein